MTKIAAKFVNMAAMGPDGGSGVIEIVVNKRSVVNSQLGNILAVGGQSGEYREGLGSPARYICRRVQPESRRLEVLHRRILVGVMTRKVGAPVEHQVRRSSIVRVEIDLRSRSEVRAGRASH